MSVKRVLVTGSSRGIGRAIAFRLAEDGWKVAVHFAAARSEAEAVAKQLGGACLGVYQALLHEPSNAEKLWQQAINDGPLHAVVNNAGVYTKLDFAGSTDAEFQSTFARTMAVNFLSPATLVRCACRHFLEIGGGKVVNVASRVGHRGEAGASAYSASKAALLNLTRALAVEHARMNIQHFAIAPGWVETSMAREGMEARLPEILRDIPLGRMAKPSDCAAAVAFFLRDEAAYLSGTVMDINGASYLR
ncbi:MAG: SDR family oxidoreductase [Armatimonadetes bacterium]|nr:SDR family oxidoreductase [Armatimonadota bacterium]